MRPLRGIAVTALAALALAAVAPGPFPVLPAAAQTQDVNCSWPHDGEWVIRTGQSVVCVGNDDGPNDPQREILVRNVTIQQGASLKLYHVTLRIHSTYDGLPNNGVYADAWGAGPTLHIVDSVVESVDAVKLPSMWVTEEASFRFERSTLRDFYGVMTVNRAYAPGEFLIQDSHFINVEGLSLWDLATPRILGNFFEGGNTQIYTEGTPQIENNTFVRCFVAIEMRGDGAAPRIANNTITGCAAGIVQTLSEEPRVVHYNDVYENTNNRPTAPLQCADASFYGDGRHNWWGRDPPNPDCFASDFREFERSPWLTAPQNPQRLPTPNLAASSASTLTGQALSFDASASQPSTHFGFPLTSYQWDFGDGATAAGAQTTHAYDHPGTYTVTLKVADEKGLNRPTTRTISVLNRPPAISNLALSPDPPVAGSSLAASASTSDPDGDPVTLSYEWRRNGFVQTDLTAASVPGNRVRAGDLWRVTITPSDPYESGAPASVQGQAPTPTQTPTQTSAPPPSTPTNRPPALGSVTFDPARPTRQSPLRAVASASDPDGDPVTLSYTWTRNGQTVTDVPGALVAQSRLVRGDVWRVTVTAHDGQGATDTGSRQVTIANSVPSLSQASADPAQATPGQSVTLTAAANDADADALTYRWVLPDGSVKTGATVQASFAQTGSKTVYVEVSDGDGGTDADTVAVTVSSPATPSTSQPLTSSTPPSSTSAAPATTTGSTGPGPTSTRSSTTTSPTASTTTPAPTNAASPTASSSATTSVAPVPVNAQAVALSTGPEVAFVSPAAGAVLLVLVEVSGTATDPSGTPLTVTAQLGDQTRTLSLDGSAWSFLLHPALLPPGPLDVAVRAENAEGQSAEAARSFHVGPRVEAAPLEASTSEAPGGQAPGFDAAPAWVAVLVGLAIVVAPRRKDPA